MMLCELRQPLDHFFRSGPPFQIHAGGAICCGSLSIIACTSDSGSRLRVMPAARFDQLHGVPACV